MVGGPLSPESIALETVRAANPPGLSRGLEEYLMGRTYEQDAARQAFREDLAQKSPDEQAAFWSEVILAEAEALYLDRQSPLLERLKAFGIDGCERWLVDDAPSVRAALVTRLVSLVEARATILLYPVVGQSHEENLVARWVLGLIQPLVIAPRHRRAVDDADATTRLLGVWPAYCTPYARSASRRVDAAYAKIGPPFPPCEE